MKKRINTIKNKVLVQGGTNDELKEHEIRLNSDLSFTERINGKIVDSSSKSSGPVFEDVKLEECIDQLSHSQGDGGRFKESTTVEGMFSVTLQSSDTTSHPGLVHYQVPGIVFISKQIYASHLTGLTFTYEYIPEKDVTDIYGKCSSEDIYTNEKILIKLVRIKQ